MCIEPDFNGDGLRDIATCGISAADVAIFLATRSGGYQSAVNVPVDKSPHGLAASDLNGDGLDDIVTANYAPGDISVLLNTSQ